MAMECEEDIQLQILFSLKDEYLINLGEPPHVCQTTVPSIGLAEIQDALTKLGVPSEAGRLRGLLWVRSTRLSLLRRRLVSACVLVEVKASTSLSWLTHGVAGASWEWKTLGEVHELRTGGGLSEDVRVAVGHAEAGEVLSVEQARELRWAEDGSWQSPSTEWEKRQREIATKAGFGQKEVELLWELWLSLVWPSGRMGLGAFRRLLLLPEFRPRNCGDEAALFRSMDMRDEDALDFPAFVCGLALIQPTLSHGQKTGEQRTKAMFRYYAASPKSMMTMDEKRRLADDICREKPDKAGDYRSRLDKHFLSTNRGTALSGFLKLVGDLSIRGTSGLLRLCEPTFPGLRERFEGSKAAAALPAALPCRSDSDTQTNVDDDYRISRFAIRLTAAGPVRECLDAFPESTVSESAQMEMGDSQNSLFDSQTTPSEATTVAEAEEIIKGLRYFQHPFSVSGSKKKPCSWTHINVITSLLESENLIGRLRRLSRQVRGLGSFREDFLILCLGDYVDRGAHGVEVVAYLFAHKVLMPKKILLLRGNHELAYLNKLFDFHKECETKFGKDLGAEVYAAANTAFACMPLAAVVDKKVFCVHGGIPSPSSLGEQRVEDAMRQLPSSLELAVKGDNPLAWELLWNDPVWSDETSAVVDADGFGPNSRRGSACVFSADALRAFLERHGFSHLVRAHQAMTEGFQVRYGGQLVTVFSSSRYCGGRNGSACVLVSDGKLSLLRIAAAKDDTAVPAAKRPRLQ